jgi:hypothetical protein
VFVPTDYLQNLLVWCVRASLHFSSIITNILASCPSSCLGTSVFASQSTKQQILLFEKHLFVSDRKVREYRQNEAKQRNRNNVVSTNSKMLRRILACMSPKRQRSKKATKSSSTMRCSNFTQTRKRRRTKHEANSPILDAWRFVNTHLALAHRNVKPTKNDKRHEIKPFAQNCRLRQNPKVFRFFIAVE